MTKEWPCEAPYHVKDCNGRGETIDHFTARCIAELLDWTPEEINAPGNKQRLSLACHEEKDRTTEMRRRAIEEQKNKIRSITLHMVRSWAKRSVYNKIDSQGRNIAVREYIQFMKNTGQSLSLASGD